MDSSSNPSLDDQRSDSSRPFPLLDDRISPFLKAILQKMKPAVLATVRESSSTVDHLLVDEALRRQFIAKTTIEEFMKQDVIPIEGLHALRAEEEHVSALIRFNRDRIEIFPRPAPFSSTSLLLHKHVLLIAGTYATTKWKNLTSQTTLYYISVSDADDLISNLSLPNPACSDYSQAEIRDIFNSPNWSA